MNLAKQDYQKAIELNSNCAEAYCGLGEVARVQGYELSIYLKITPFGWFLIGNEQFNKEKVAHSVKQAKNEAATLYQQAINLAPDNKNLYYTRARFYEDIELCTFAAEDWSKVIELDSNDFYAYVKRGVNLNNSQDYVSALKDFNKALDLIQTQDYGNATYLEKEINPKYMREIKFSYYDPNSYLLTIYEGRADAYLGLKEYEKALEDFNKVVGRKNPVVVRRNPAVVYCKRAQVYEALEQPDRALADYNRALEIDKKYKPAKEGKKRTEKAAKNLAKLR